MAFNLLNFLGQAVGFPVGQETIPEMNDPRQIEVSKRVQRPQMSPQDLVPRSLDNRDFIAERDQALQNGRDSTTHKGMFGTKGTLRDILGLVGDAFLVQSGNKPLYRTKREQEDIGDAMAGFTQDYQGAAERTSGLDPELAYKLNDQGLTDQQKREALASIDANRQSMMQDRQWTNIDQARERLSRLFNLPGAQKNPAMAMRQAQLIARSAGTTLENLGVTPDMTPEEMAMYGSSGMTPYQQEQLPIAQQNADSRRISATRPRAASRPPQPTAASIAAPLLEKVRRGEKLAPNELEVLDRSGYEIPKSAGRRPRPGQAPQGQTTATSRFRRLN